MESMEWKSILIFRELYKFAKSYDVLYMLNFSFQIGCMYEKNVTYIKD